MKKALRIPLKVGKVGSSLGIALPNRAVRELRIKEGDCLLLTEAPGGFQLTFHDPSFEEIMEHADGFLKRYKNALRELAK